MDWLGHPGIAWLIAAVGLAIAELAVPGVFLVFLAIAAAITGALALLLPGMTTALAFTNFAIWAAAIVWIGKRWYADYPVETSDPLLNDRVARLVGQVVTVSVPIEHGEGRVRVGDGEWPALGPDTPAGTKMRITGGQGAVLTVEPVTLLP